MKNILSCNSGRTHTQDAGAFNRGNELSNLMHYFWNYVDTPAALAEQIGAAANVEMEPRMQVVETKDAVHITAELPGISEKDLDLKVSSDGYLSLCGEKKNVHEETDKNAYFSEISYGTFKRTIPLPWDLDYDKVTASFKNGILSVDIPKSQVEKQKFKKITINNTEAHSAAQN